LGLLKKCRRVSAHRHENSHKDSESVPASPPTGAGAYKTWAHISPYGLLLYQGGSPFCNAGTVWASVLSSLSQPRPKPEHQLLCEGRQEQRDRAEKKTFRRVSSSSWRRSLPSAASESARRGSPPEAAGWDTFTTAYSFTVTSAASHELWRGATGIIATRQASCPICRRLHS
jgi:hypothetical protein